MIKQVAMCYENFQMKRDTFCVTYLLGTWSEKKISECRKNCT